MRDELKFKDFYRFLIDNKKTIVSTIVVTLIMGLAFAGLSNLGLDDSDTVNTKPVESSKLISEEKYEEYAEWPIEQFTDPQIKQMQAYLLPKAYKITLYTEHEDYEPITNTTFMREVFRNNDVIDYIEENLDENLTPNVDFAIHIENLGNSGVYELHFQRGSQEKSLELAYTVMDAIDQDVIPVLKNKNVYFVEEEPELVQQDYSDSENEITDNFNFSIKSLIKDVIIFGLIGIILGTIVGISIALLGLVTSKNVTALFDYAQKDSDKVVRLNHLKQVDQKEYLNKGLININTPTIKSKVVLYDEKTKEAWNDLFARLKPNVSKYNDFANVSSEIKDIDEVIILSKINETSKAWYNNQRVQLNGYNIPIKIIQF